MITTLSREQVDFLLLMGKPNDGRMECFVGDSERILAELLQMGLAYRYKGLDGKFTHDLTDEGEALHRSLREYIAGPRNQLLSQFDVDDVQTTIRTLQAITARAEQELALAG